MSGYLVIIIYIWRIDEYMWYAVNGIRKQHLVTFFFLRLSLSFRLYFSFSLFFLPTNLDLTVILPRMSKVRIAAWRAEDRFRYCCSDSYLYIDHGTTDGNSEYGAQV